MDKKPYIKGTVFSSYAMPRPSGVGLSDAEVLDGLGQLTKHFNEMLRGVLLPINKAMSKVLDRRDAQGPETTTYLNWGGVGFALVIEIPTIATGTEEAAAVALQQALAQSTEQIMAEWRNDRYGQAYLQAGRESEGPLDSSFGPQ
ncbi:hypothetical protein EOL96_04515 [Candidatus Saccharibacteria bacterium]|nr:hypothetical protein [Candidatus Saccharibacteria bacterium]